MMDFSNPANWCLVGRSGDQISLLRPPPAFMPFGRDDALLLAAWLIVMVDPAEGEFERALDAVLAT